MILTKKIRDKFYTYFLNRLGMFDYTRGWLKGDCPYCGKTEKFGIHLGSDKSNCFSCGPHGSTMQVIKDVERVETDREVHVIVGTYETIEYKEDPIIEYIKREVKLPEGFVSLNSGDSITGNMVRNYIRNRGLDPVALSRKGFGYCNSGPQFGYLIMPFYMKGGLIYYHTRNLLGNGPKFDNPKIEEFGIGKSSIIYNIDALWVYRTVYLVESVLNAETMGDMGIASGGKKLSKYQVSTIIKSPVENVIILLDDDAYEDSLNLALSLSPYKRVKVCLMPVKKDVNDLGREATLNIIHQNRYLQYPDIIKLKNNYLHEKGSQFAY